MARKRTKRTATDRPAKARDRLSELGLVRCAACGEVADRGLVRCPGCGRGGLPELRADQRLRIPKAQRQARQDRIGANFALGILGLMILGNGAGFLSRIVGLPYSVSVILMVIAFATLVVWLRSPERTRELLAGKGHAGEFVMEIGNVILNWFAKALIAVVIVVGGFIVFMYIVCAGFSVL